MKRPVHKYENIAKLYSIMDRQPHIMVPRKPAGVVVGRSSACDIRLGGADVSSKHCQFSLSSNNKKEYLLLTDMSSNGTAVNNEVLGKGTTTLLRSGDKISFAKSGSYIFRYVSDEQENMVQRSFFDDYILLNQLGSGHYAVVKEARDRTTGDIVAVKIFHPSKTSSKGSSEEEAKLKQEMALLLAINHPNIVRFISHYVEPINAFSSTTYLEINPQNSYFFIFCLYFGFHCSTLQTSFCSHYLQLGASVGKPLLLIKLTQSLRVSI